MVRIAVVCALVAIAAAANMNGDYVIANPNPKAPNPFNSEYNAEFFEVYSPPLRTQYSEVFWTMMDPVPLNQTLVNRFTNKTMAIIGYEANQVFVTPNGDVSVPIYWNYNHHYEAYLHGLYSTMVKDTGVSDAASAYGGLPSARHKGMLGRTSYHLEMLPDAPNPDSEIPTAQFFSEGNGGEYRKSFHGYPKGYAQLIDSPTTFYIQPMQIDTHNREYNGSGFKPWLLPRSSQAPPDATYSGILECPCTTRIVKKYSVRYNALSSGVCPTVVSDADSCFAGAATISKIINKNQTESTTSLPNGCVILPTSNTTATAVFNAAPTSGQACGSSQKIHVKGSATSLVTMTLELDASTDVNGVATITLSGPSTVWFGVGFGATAMADEPYTIVVNGTGGVEEHKIADHSQGIVLAPSLKLVSSSVSQGIRTVVLTRPFKGASADYYTFDPVSQSNIQFIDAVGSGAAFAYHKSKATSTISLVGVSATTCVCDGGSTGTINGFQFGHNCAPEPYGDLLQQHNPTCDVRTYAGGLMCCHHQWFLLDSDQQVPAGVDEFHLKFRFYFEEYNPAVHQNLVRFYYTTELGAGEYDVVQCPDGTPAEECVHTITAHWKVSDMLHNCNPRTNPECTGDKGGSGINIIYAGGHCHAPSCIALDLYNADTGQLLCHQEPTFGKTAEVFDEDGYIALPPCLWGSLAEGLQEPVFLSMNTNLMSVKSNNNTVGHYGEMASWQMRGVVIP